MPYLLDSVIFIDHFNGLDAATRFIAEYCWKLPDALQAAVAINHGARLVTRNSKDFPPQKHSFVLSPYTLPLKQ